MYVEVEAAVQAGDLSFRRTISSVEKRYRPRAAQSRPRCRADRRGAPAAHQQPQQFQVVVPKSRPAIRCGRVEVDFVARRNAVAIPTEKVNTPRGFLRISSPEATAFELVGYQERCGGLNNVATVLAELAERLDARQLAALGPLSPIPRAQRLGHLLDRFGHSTWRSATNAGSSSVSDSD
jgi:hypothetical protein